MTMKNTATNKMPPQLQAVAQPNTQKNHNDQQHTTRIMHKILN